MGHDGKRGGTDRAGSAGNDLVVQAVGIHEAVLNHRGRNNDQKSAANQRVRLTGNFVTTPRFTFDSAGIALSGPGSAPVSDWRCNMS